MFAGKFKLDVNLNNHYTGVVSERVGVKQIEQNPDSRRTQI